MNARIARPSLTMKKPQKLAQGKGTTIPRSSRSPRGADAAGADTSPVEKHVVSATSATPFPKPRQPPSSSAFLQPEQFIAELQVAKSPDVRPELAFLASRHPRSRRESPKSVANSESNGGTMVVLNSQPDLESFYEPANTLPTLALRYDGKPAPAPAHLRTKTSNPVVTETPVSKNRDTGDSPGESSLVLLQKSGSSGGVSFKGASDGAQQKVRVRSLRENSGMLELEEKPSSALRRMLQSGSSMEFLKSLGRKSKKKKQKKKQKKKGTTEFASGKREEQLRSQPIEPDSIRDREEESASPRSSASSVSTTYSEVSSKSHSYKHAGSKKNVNPEPVSSRLRMPGKDSQDDGTFEALRQGAMGGGEDDDTLRVLETKKSVAVKHKRNSTWDAGNQMAMAPGDPLFTPKQPRLPSRDAHVLLAPPRRLLTGAAAASDRNTNASRVTELSLPLPILVETTTPSPSASPSPCPIGSQSFRTSPQLHAASRHLSSQPPNAAGLSTNQGLQTSSQRQAVPNASAPPSPPGGAELQQTSLTGSQTPGSRSLRLTSPQRHESSALVPPPPKSLSRSHSAIASFGFSILPTLNSGLVSLSLEDGVPPPLSPSLPKPKPQIARAPPTWSFEHIVAGRGRMPPTDNTLMKFFFKCREIEGLNKFLAVQKRRFLEESESEREQCFHMIMSEAGKGLSSLISTICTAWLLENTMASATSRVWHPIPVMNMGQQDMWRHRDAAWLFHVCGIDANSVLFRDEIPPTNEAVILGRVKRAIVGQDVFVTKADEVASSCTIVSEKFRQEAAKLLQARYMMTLLLAGILVDTNNLSSGSPRDKQQATMLLVGAGSLGRNVFYNHLINIRDENYVTTFIKEIYGDSNALTGEKPAAHFAVESKSLSPFPKEKFSASSRPVSFQLPATEASTEAFETESRASEIPPSLRRLRSRSGTPVQ